MNALIIAFDGLLAETLGVRTDAVLEALRGEHIEPERALVAAALPGRTLHEEIRRVSASTDETLLDLLTLRAQALLSARIAQGIAIAPNAQAFLARTRAAGTRLVLRSDSARRDVERVLALGDLESTFAFVRCADDLSAVSGGSSLERSYIAITRRLDALGGGGDRAALECSAPAAETARRYVGSVRVCASLP